MLSIVLFFGFLAVATNAGVPYVTEQPPYLPPCQIKDPDFVKCSTRSVQTLFTEIGTKGGLPGIDSVPPLDPLKISKIRVTQSGNQAINIKVDLTNVIVTGFGKIKIIESRVSSKDYSWDTRISLPKMVIKGDYIMKGRMLLINLNGQGKTSLQIDNPTMQLHTTTRLYEKGGLTFYNVTNVKGDYTITRLTTYFSNLFNGNKELEESTNVFFNENWEALSEALRPVLRKTIAEIFQSYMAALFHVIPAEFFVTDIPTPKELYGE